MVMLTTNPHHTVFANMYSHHCLHHHWNKWAANKFNYPNLHMCLSKTKIPPMFILIPHSIVWQNENPSAVIAETQKHMPISLNQVSPRWIILLKVSCTDFFHFSGRQEYGARIAALVILGKAHKHIYYNEKKILAEHTKALNQNLD